MLITIAAALMAFQGQGDLIEAIFLQNPDGGKSKSMLRISDQRLDPPKLSPGTFPPNDVRWQFDWMVPGFGLQPDGTSYALKFRVYAQQKKATNDPAEAVARLAMRLWEFNRDRFKIEHTPLWGPVGLVDFYLCWGGEPGGEQRIEDDDEGGKLHKVNSIYIYDIRSFQGGVEMAREVCHEYGHATLPAVGGFEKPEDWANGYLGEKIYMRWLRDELAAKRLNTTDAMGASLAQLDAWVKTNDDPLLEAVALKGPDRSLLKSKGPEAMNAYIGVALWADTVLTHKAVSRSMLLIGSQSASDYPTAVVDAASELPTYTVRVPASLAGKAIWIPLGKGTVSGAKVLQRGSGWAQVHPSGASFTVKNPKID